ncbi:UbiX family flavin prenyltransferase [Saccharolobus islandicus]|jgi:polyprenyl P-hydroxybenzoate and phenylacrylic acid decarboxylases|uniref:Flavin prenyltransferase UbiX n=8 Tax=Saccharolobus islandicus TaxID=43080 RepID=M9UA72_SACIS|nr:UbiX family flavin prenyltransferase [Sulfolobus islandicus]ACP35792.1 3-octaprenyl-4-hydroxybenzoate carboxy-lyase [Sulfolobus islandicus L.S.2.15]ACP38417.1 3-octaprenyl-4-hydroxybenzoate carboxy-lyase [Sulfolobus islandicus M.14.25]ACP55659.1 3-octaprenyl-4-hydroxybenzoate carboxy-lyase [Sulfolobus islandicus M.16.27]ACR42320.1 3-octaprenyl-4-hydroxybenzoate carboxy-lyase [Sulfolobus islandicus M.16.4]ADB87582.1 3-octaprenyl-4-hydroxybenzoate carboxy-lyase [Sulfolobus islandicus L.D.8.5]
MVGGLAKEAGTKSGREKAKRVIIGISGASGTIYGIRTVQFLNELGYETHIIISKSAEKVAQKELGINLIEELKKYSSNIYIQSQIEAAPSSSSFSITSESMIIIPCSIKTLAEIANGIGSNLLSRTALNFIRTNKKLVLVIRETPLGAIELENALKLARLGVLIMPASPAFYILPKTIDEMVNFVVGKALDLLGIKHDIYKRWKG